LTCPSFIATRGIRFNVAFAFFGAGCAMDVELIDFGRFGLVPVCDISSLLRLWLFNGAVVTIADNRALGSMTNVVLGATVSVSTPAVFPT
jgi:hypothetical protein